VKEKGGDGETEDRRRKIEKKKKKVFLIVGEKRSRCRQLVIK